MNTYQEAMEHCPLPEGMQERLRERVLSTSQERKRRIVRPIVRWPVVIAAVLVGLTVSVAAIMIGWGEILQERFGSFNFLARKVFRPINVSSVCDDVTVTVREAAGDGTSISYVLEYQLSDTVSPEILKLCETEGVSFPQDILYCATGDISWEEYKASGGEKWPELEWVIRSSDDPNPTEEGHDWITGFWHTEENLLYQYAWRSGGGSGSLKGYDPETRTITYLYEYTIRPENGKDFTTQPLTLAIAPPKIETDTMRIAVVNHPAMITFNPDFADTRRQGTFQQDDVSIHVTVDSMSLSVNACGTEYQDIKTMVYDTALIDADGRETSLSSMCGGGYTGNQSSDETGTEIAWTTHFRQLLDTKELSAIRVGETTIPLK